MVMSLSTALTSNAAEGASGRSSSRRWCGRPRLRRDWQDAAEEKLKATGDCPLLGRVTREEGMWGVIVTMGIAAMRDTILKNHDVEWYVLHFFCFWGPMSSSVMYSTRFNDEDAFHSILWASFLFGMFGQVAFLDGNLTGFAGSTCFLYFLFAIAYFRIAWCLPRARAFAGYFGGMCSLAAVAFALLSLGSCSCRNWERLLLMSHVCLEPLCVAIFVAATWTRELRRHWDIPVCIDHMISRYKGFHMMIIVCSFLFPIGLCGVEFAGDLTSPPAIAVLCANVYALMLKLVIFDLGVFNDDQNGPDVQECHAIRISRYKAVAFVHTFSLSMLGIALSGVGFVAAIKAESITFTQPLLCGGISLTWFMIAFESILHRRQFSGMERRQTLLSFGASLTFLFPWVIGFSLSSTLAFVVFTMLILFALKVSVRAATADTGAVHGWQWRRPQFTLGQSVTSHEHFFTIMLAVCIFQLSALVGQNRDMEHFFVYFMIFYLVIQASMRYAARFNDNDASHKLLWSLYQFGLLLMLEFLGAADRQSFDVVTAGMFTLVGFLCSVRIAFHIPRVRIFCSYFATVYACMIIILIWDCVHFHEFNSSRWCLWVCIGLSVLADWMVIGLSSFFDSFNIHTSIDYIVSRFDGLFIEVLGVALIVPAAIYPGAHLHPTLVLFGEMLAVLLAIALKVGFFDVESVDFDHHAVHRAKWSAVIFVNIYPFTLFGLCMTGASLPLLITSAGTYGQTSQDIFAQRLVCTASCLTWICLSVTKLLHIPKANIYVHMAKVFVQALGAAASLLPLLSDECSDLGTLCIVVGLNVLIVLSQMLLKRFCSFQPPLPPSVSEESLPSVCSGFSGCL